jgi:hypothetical protein
VKKAGKVTITVQKWLYTTDGHKAHGNEFTVK